LIPTINENLAGGGSIQYATLVIAAWCLYSDKGRNRHGVELDIVDEMKDELHRAAKGTEDDPLSFLRLKTIFGDLVDNGAFTALYSEMVRAIYQDFDVAPQMRKMVSA
jgi:mannitol 2-dehydrogenase